MEVFRQDQKSPHSLHRIQIVHLHLQRLPKRLNKRQQVANAACRASADYKQSLQPKTVNRAGRQCIYKHRTSVTVLSCIISILLNHVGTNLETGRAQQTICVDLYVLPVHSALKGAAKYIMRVISSALSPQR